MQNQIRKLVRRERAENYILTSLVAFAVTVIVTRVFLHWSGYPQIGNEVLHIAHALWGGLFLIIAVYLPLAFANRWAISTSALLSGVGIGLFIDEIGKFITQSNDYFFPPALSLIYGFILLNVLVYILFRRSNREDSRQAMYYVLDELQDALDGDLDEEEAALIEAHLMVAMQSDREEIVSLASVIRAYLKQEAHQLKTVKTNLWKRITSQVDAFGKRVGHQGHRSIISGLLVLWVVCVIGYIIILVQGGANIDPQILQWRFPLIVIQIAVAILMVVAGVAWFTRKEDLGLKLAVSGFMLSLVALQTLYFYLSQISALTATLIQFLFLQILFTYRRWYLNERTLIDTQDQIS
jgi:hypothetical protein